MTTTESRAGRIVIGYDGSSSSAVALEWAARQAELTGGTLEIVTTWEWPTTYGAPMPIPERYTPQDDAQALLDEAEQAARATHPAIEVRKTMREGHPAPALVAASEGADLLVVGSRGHGAFVGMVLGSVSEHCVTNAHCPVLVLRQG